MRTASFLLKIFFVGSACALAFAALPARAATGTANLEVSGWLPYWREATSTADALAHLDYFTEINPFGYTVKSNGTLHDPMGITDEPWKSLIAAAKKQKVRVIPTVMWSDGEAIHRILSNQKTRIALEDEIAALVKANNFDGIDIDFEGKRAETKDYFSTFLKGLYMRMGNKWVMCTIEARTPATSRYESTPPADAYVYANDFAAINKYCDRVRLMTYDQGTIDLKLNAAANGEPYIPVSDPLWVEKVVNLTAQTIPKRKLSIGIATYGYEYQVTKLSQSGYRYDLEWAFNPGYAYQIAAQYGVLPVRNRAGELSLMYNPTSTPAVATVDQTQPGVLNISTTSYSEASGYSSTTAPIATNILWWSDAAAIQQKIALAQKLGVRGVSLFKIDGGEDLGLWNILTKKR